MRAAGARAMYERWHQPLWIGVPLFVVLAVALVAVMLPRLGHSPAHASAGGLHVRGNVLVDSAGQTVRLVGVDRSGAEFKCIQGGSATSRGWGIFDGPTDLASAQKIVGWHANAVRVPLNEDCWLGINGVNPMYSGQAYRNAITSYVQALHQAGLYVIIDLHWNSPAGIPALAQQPMPDANHAPAFWQSVAATFRNDQATVFDLYNEPFIYGSYLQNPSQDPWSCWLNGCGFNQYLTGGQPYTQKVNWQAVGMQTLVNTIRGAGAGNVIMVGGLDWANDLSGWLTHEPVDPDRNLAASWHSYPGQGCSPSTCWTSVIAPIAARVPVIVGETGDNVCSTTTYDPSFLPWADSHGLSYVGWTWNTWSDCADVLIKDYNGTPTSNYGQYFHDHLAALAAHGGSEVLLLSGGATTASTGSSGGASASTGAGASNGGTSAGTGGTSTGPSGGSTGASGGSASTTGGATLPPGPAAPPVTGVTITQMPCVVTVGGVQKTGMCSGNFVRDPVSGSTTTSVTNVPCTVIVAGMPRQGTCSGSVQH